jgi:hypothetical protein
VKSQERDCKVIHCLLAVVTHLLSPRVQGPLLGVCSTEGSSAVATEWPLRSSR